ncbi:MAG: alanine--tRNA ligase [Anaerolineaceae bacterium]|nr:alanine--tRNA ligase [Anaerolineaceae bacterium]
MTLTGNQIRQSFLDFFAERGHTVVPSASLIPGGDSTLLFTNAGMVQFKDVFLGLDTRPYTRAVDSQKCLRVSGKHNDLDTVGRDNTHHTFFEMLGNWSFGDYYKDEAIAWSWELLTKVWGLDPRRLYATIFEDEEGVLPTDSEAAEAWLRQPGFVADQLLTGGRHDNLWEMAETGPCGPCTEIHYDFGPEACNMQHVPGHTCQVNGECSRIVEIWNNVFIQYNRVSPTEFVPLPKKHVDTGMGFERIVSIIQGVKGNYETDLLKPLLDETQRIARQSDEERLANITPYRVIADHTRAACFLMADGVIPGNIGRNYVCRMIIRRAARFARKIGLMEPFMAQVAAVVIANYGQAYPELLKSENLIAETFTREEQRFAETLDAGNQELNRLIEDLKALGRKQLAGADAFDLYATLGFPLEITRDILAEQGFTVDEKGFYEAMEAHRIASGKGQTFGEMGNKNSELYASSVSELVAKGALPQSGVAYDPYTRLSVQTPLLAIFKDGQSVQQAHPGDEVELLLAETPFYIESGGQVADSGCVYSDPAGAWQVEIHAVSKPSAAAVLHHGKVFYGSPKPGDRALAQVDFIRRRNIMRNHTATHLLQAMIREVLGHDAHQAGSAVDDERLRFDFNYPHALSKEQLLEIEAGVNRLILGEHPVIKSIESLAEAKAKGAMALFGEKYGETVRTIQVGNPAVSYELCGGTHVDNAGEIGSFFITGEMSVSAGMRRIEAVTGDGAYAFARARLNLMTETANALQTSPADVPSRLESLQTSLKNKEKEISALQSKLAQAAFSAKLDSLNEMNGVRFITGIVPEATPGALRELVDQFRQKHPSGLIALGSAVDGKPTLIAAVSPDLIARGLKAGELIKDLAAIIGGGGGGKPELAQAGGKDPSKLSDALETVQAYIQSHVS